MFLEKLEADCTRWQSKLTRFILTPLSNGYTNDSLMLPDLSGIKLPLHFTISQQRTSYAKARDGEEWRVRVGLLDLEITGFPTIEDTISLLRSTVMTHGRQLVSVNVVDLNQGSIGPIMRGNECVATAETRCLTITAEPASALRELIYESYLVRLQRLVLDAAKQWRTFPEDTSAESAWWVALRQMENAIDDLLRWEKLRLSG